MLASSGGSGGIGIEASATNGMPIRITPDGGAIAMPPTINTWQAGSMRVDDEGDIWYCYADGAGTASGWYPLSLVPAFIPLAAPQRIYNSATVDGPILNGQERTISSLTGGFIPPTAFAGLFNLAVFSTTGTLGFLAAFSADAAYPGHSNINWFGTNQILANSFVTSTDLAGAMKIHCGTTGSTQFVVDALGFYTLTA
jgi:hypothetical protein